MPPKRIFKKTQNFEFFQKMGPRGQKNENFEKTFSKSKRASKFEYKTCATLPEREKKFLSFL